MFQYLDFSSRKKRDWRGLRQALSTGKSNNFTKRPRRPLQKAPTLFATFELSNGRPSKSGASYDIKLEARGVPADTKQVKYEILDETFADNKFTVDRRHPGFEETITSWGDVVITVKGVSRGRTWRTQSTLYQALQRGPGKNPSPAIKKALIDIKNN